MTDRLKGLIVTFESSIREDDAEAIINAIKMVKGVASVTPSVDNVDDMINRQRVKNDLRTKFYELWQQLFKD